MSAATTAPAFRYIGTTDECIECQKCGKSDLRSTVVLAILDTDGSVEAITYYGSTCAARALNVRGGGRAVLQSARWAADRTRKEAAAAITRGEALGFDARTGEITAPRGFAQVVGSMMRRNGGAIGNVRCPFATREAAEEFTRELIADDVRAVREAALIGG